MGALSPAQGRRRGARRVGLAEISRRLIVVAVVVALTGVTAPIEPTSAAQGVATVDADALNVRAEPGTWAWVIAQLGYGEPVTVISGPTEDGWYQVQHGGITGWVHGWYILIGGAPGWAPLEELAPIETTASPAVDDPTPNDPGPIAFEQPAAWDPSLGVGGTGGAAWVATDGLNVRAAPKGDAGVIDVFRPGDAVTVIGGSVDGYVPVEHWSGAAWVWGAFLSYDAPPGPEHWIDVNRTSQMVTLYEGDQPIASYWGAMGLEQSDGGFFATAMGTFYVYEKYADLSWTDWGGAWVRHWVAFDPERLNGFHSYSMDANGQVIHGGDGPTGGCVALAPWAAEHLFSFVQLGSRVEVHW